MKICVLHRYPLSIIEGTNPSFPLFLKKVLEAGNEIFLVTFKNGKNCSFEGRVNMREINISFGRRSYPEVLFKSLLFIIVAPLKVYLLNKREKFDLIYCDDSFPFYEILIKILIRNKVLMRRGDLMCAYILDKFGIFVNIFAQWILLIEKFIWNKVDGISIITNRFKQYLLKYGINENKIYVIEDSLDFTKFRDAKGAEAIKERYNITDEFIVMYHGTMLCIKGLNVLLHAVPIVIHKYKNIKFFLVGAGEEFEKLKRLTRNLKMEDYVIFTGWVKYDDIPAYLSICDIGIPIRKDTVANNLVITTALLQYWASSKPVIAPRLVAMSEVIKENINGFLFKPGDSNDLALKIIEAVNKRHSLIHMGQKGRDFVRERFNPELIADKMLNFINTTLLIKN